MCKVLCQAPLNQHIKQMCKVTTFTNMVTITKLAIITITGCRLNQVRLAIFSMCKALCQAPLNRHKKQLYSLGVPMFTNNSIPMVLCINIGSLYMLIDTTMLTITSCRQNQSTLIIFSMKKARHRAPMNHHKKQMTSCGGNTMKIHSGGGNEHPEVQSQCTKSLRSSSQMQITWCDLGQIWNTIKNPALKVKETSTMYYTDSTDASSGSVD